MKKITFFILIVILIFGIKCSPDAKELEAKINARNQQLHMQKFYDSIALQEKLEKANEINKLKIKGKSDFKFMSTSFDEFSGITFYTDKSSREGTGIYIYIGKIVKKMPYLRFKLTYSGSHWIFWKEARFKVCNDIIPFVPFNLKHDNDSYVYEVTDEPMSYTDYKLVQYMIKCGKVKIRFRGDDKNEDYEVTQKEIEAMGRVLNVYYYLGGQENFN